MGSGAFRAAHAAERLTIIASLFPQYDFARRIAGDDADVRLLLPPGGESHSYEPTPSDMKAIAGADVFIYTGPEMEPWAATLAGAAETGLIVDASARVKLTTNTSADDHDGHEDHEHDDHFHAYDPHIWLDPIHAVAMVETIADALAERAPASAPFYRTNAETLIREIRALDAEFRSVVDAAARTELVFGDRFAFTYFFARYGLEEFGPYASCAPGSEPGVKAVIATVERVRAHGIRCIYYEAQSTGRLAQVIADETGAALLAVDSLHNPTAQQRADGFSYVDGMRANMLAFAKGLE